jgi:hypothetical protein
VVPVALYKRKVSKKKGTPGLRMLSKNVRRVIEVQRNFMDTYEAAHDRSNDKKRDGWLSDLPRNLTRAGRKATKKLLKWM